MTTAPSTADVRHACTVLSSPALIRLITEIDDNGPIPPRGLARTLADLPVHRLRQATDLARALGLVRPGSGLGLTAPGLELADIYDASARWARRHAYPAAVCDFTGRIQHTLAALAEAPVVAADGSPRAATDGPLPSADAVADLAGPRDLLLQWLHTNPQVAQTAPAA
ncbi:hypothetical protein [Streptomyces sp. JJ38]|uniref:hypothetical protein n=1 Tax=Streptomyces sp. JJ38 TaxID=2738128 RepID=UPI001C57ED75|nr:hypothetical protein [Streptomyces sp. JJ38]MBW1597267.1 hypothetical protein [Streptomyces sp. JJ38]